MKKKRAKKKIMRRKWITERGKFKKNVIFK